MTTLIVTLLITGMVAVVVAVAGYVVLTVIRAIAMNDMP